MNQFDPNKPEEAILAYGEMMQLAAAKEYQEKSMLEPYELLLKECEDFLSDTQIELREMRTHGGPDSYTPEYGEYVSLEETAERLQKIINKSAGVN